VLKGCDRVSSEEAESPFPVLSCSDQTRPATLSLTELVVTESNHAVIPPPEPIQEDDTDDDDQMPPLEPIHENDTDDDQMPPLEPIHENDADDDQMPPLESIYHRYLYFANQNISDFQTRPATLSPTELVVNRLSAPCQFANIESRPGPIVFTNDTIVNTVIQSFISRSNLGFKKYNNTLDREDLSTVDWVNHTQEELMDAILYLERLKKNLQK
jgi:hypothetical protein